MVGRHWLTALLSLLALPALLGCASRPICPATLGAIADEEPAAMVALIRWNDAVDLANGFLASEHRETLPAGQFDHVHDGLVFRTGDLELPITVKATSWGTLCNWFGFTAQERSWGFVVGRRGGGHELVANSLFLDPEGRWYHPADIASLLLHETTHTLYGLGTVSCWAGTKYYLEAIFLLRYRNHSGERLPYATSDEFVRWWRDPNREAVN